MPIAPRLQEFLSGHAVAYQLISHSSTETLEEAARHAQLPPEEFARAVPMNLDGKLLVAVVPLSHVIDFSALSRLLGGSPQPVPAGQVTPLFSDCEVACIPAFAHLYGIETIYDEALFEGDSVVLEAGCRTGLLRLSTADLRRLIAGQRQSRIARSPESLERAESSQVHRLVSELAPSSDLERRLDRIHELPPLPDSVAELLALRRRGDVSAAHLAQVVESDPSLAAQVMKYARSPLFGYAGEVDNLHQAIARVLGTELVMNLALGLAALKPFKIPRDGPLGLRAFERHATLTACLARRLVRQQPASTRLEPEIAYLAGLLHNFGHLMLGYMFPPEFYLLNRVVAANPRVPVRLLERQVLGMGDARRVMELGHGELGAWLLQRWGLPEEVVVTAREHHNPDYANAHAGYVRLILACDCLLKSHAIGEGCSEEIPKRILEDLGLEEAAAREIAAELVEAGNGGAAISA